MSIAVFKYFETFFPPSVILMRAKLIFAKLLDSLLFSFSVFLFAVYDIRTAIGKHLIIYDVCEAGKVCVCVCVRAHACKRDTWVNI